MGIEYEARLTNGHHVFTALRDTLRASAEFDVRDGAPMCLTLRFVGTSIEGQCEDALIEVNEARVYVVFYLGVRERLLEVMTKVLKEAGEDGEFLEL